MTRGKFRSASALAAFLAVGGLCVERQATGMRGPERTFPSLPAAGSDAAFDLKPKAAPLQRATVQPPEYLVWEIGKSANSQRFTRWAGEALGARPTPVYIAGKSLLAVVGPDLPPGTEAGRLAALLATKKIPVIGVGTGGMQVLAALDPKHFHAGPRPFTRAESADRDKKGLETLYSAAAKDSPLSDHPSVPLYPVGRVVALADASRLPAESIILRRWNEPGTAVAGWEGVHAFWGPSDAEVLETELIDLYEALAGEVSKAGMPKKQWDKLVALAEVAAQATNEVQKKDDARVQTIVTEHPAPASLTPPAQFNFPTKGVITSRFGSRFHPILHFVRPHNGVDIGAPIGQTVVASAPGIVQVADGGGFGKHVVLVHGGGTTTVYGHLSTVDAHSGQQVAAGAPIGRVGNTGLSTGPHLHFELHQGGKPVDPAPHLQPLHFKFVH